MLLRERPGDLEGAPGAGGALEGAPGAGGAGRGAGAAGGRVAGHLTEEEKNSIKTKYSVHFC